MSGASVLQSAGGELESMAAFGRVKMGDPRPAPPSFAAELLLGPVDAGWTEKQFVDLTLSLDAGLPLEPACAPSDSGRSVFLDLTLDEDWSLLREPVVVDLSEDPD